MPILACLIPTPSSCHGQSRYPGAVQGAGEPPTDFSHADDMNAWDGNFNHSRTS